MKTTHLKETEMLLVIAVLCLVSLIPIRVIADPAPAIQKTDDKYDWTGELVNLDSNNHIITVKAPVVGSHAPSEFGHFKAGDRIVVTWSGFFNYGNGVKSGMLYDAAKRSDTGEYAFPVEFVSYDATRQEVTFKAAIPSGSVEALKSLKPGEWIRATSPHHPIDEKTVIVDVKPYVGSNKKG